MYVKIVMESKKAFPKAKIMSERNLCVSFFMFSSFQSFLFSSRRKILCLLSRVLMRRKQRQQKEDNNLNYLHFLQKTLGARNLFMKSESRCRAHRTTPFTTPLYLTPHCFIYLTLTPHPSTGGGKRGRHK